ncbi:unnamed protein product [Urochloa humidicola]
MPNVQSGIPHLHVPRMRDLLSTQLGFLSGRPLQAFLQMFDQFDLTLSDNTRAIHASLCNIARAPFHLAEQCRPVLDEIIAAQRSTDPNIVGETSRRNNASEHGQYTNDVDIEDNTQDNSPIDPFQSPSSCHNDPNSSHDMGRLNTLFDAISDEEDASSTPLSPNNVVPKVRPAGKRMIRKPYRFCSPFKYGVMSRPPPNSEASLNLLAYICDENSPLRSTPVIQFGITPLSGAIVAQSFADSALVVDPIFMNGFVKCLSYDDFYIRPECHGYRILLDAHVSAILNVDWDKRDSCEPKYNQPDALAAIGRCLPFTNLKMAKLIRGSSPSRAVVLTCR